MAHAMNRLAVRVLARSPLRPRAQRTAFLLPTSQLRPSPLSTAAGHAPFARPRSSTNHPAVRDRIRQQCGSGRPSALSDVTLDSQSKHLLLHFADVPLALPVSRLWLRDSCQCERCVSPSSGQKRFRTVDLDDDPAIQSFGLSDQGAALTVEWAEPKTAETEGPPHVSTYAADALLRQVGRLPKFAQPERLLWDRALLERQLRPVAFADWKDGTSPAFWRGLRDLHQLGILIVDGVPDSETAVEQVAAAIGNIHETFYGRTWNVVSKPQAENVAYTNEFLCLHQDLMYMREPPYIQLLHCLRNECDGGESLFSDGLRAALEMELRWHVAEPLLRRAIPYHYERHGHYYFHKKPVIRRGRNNEVVQTAWSPPFQDALEAPRYVHGSAGVSAKDNGLLQWKKAAGLFSASIEDPANMYEFKMKPGQCVLFNNMRVLHGRQHFNTSQGTRWLKGTYISTQTFLSKVAAMIQEDRLPQDERPQLVDFENVHAGEVKQAARLLGTA